jgi:hypothetical protein
MFSLRYLDILPVTTGDEISSLCGQVSKFAEQQHNADGTHGAVTADSVQLQGALAGEVIDLPFDAARYDRIGGTSWTVSSGDQIYLRYTRIGQLVFLNFNISTSVIVGTPDTLVIRIPELHAIPTVPVGSSTPVVQGSGLCEWNDVEHGTDGSAQAIAIASDFGGVNPSTYLYLERLDATGFVPFVASTDFGILGSLTFFVERDNMPHTFFGS